MKKTTDRDKKIELLMRRTLTVSDKDTLFAVLRGRSGLLEKRNVILSNLSQLVVELIRDHVLPKDISINYDKIKRITKSLRRVSITGSSLGLSEKNNETFPNDIAGMPDYSENKRKKISTKLQISLNNKELPLIPEECLESKKNKEYFNNIYDSYILDGAFFKNVPTIKLDTLKRTFMDYLIVNYEIVNFLIDYYPEKLNRISSWKTYHFLNKKKTWGQVKKINEEWFNILIEKQLNDEEKKDLEKDLTLDEEIKELKLLLGY